MSKHRGNKTLKPKGRPKQVPYRRERPGTRNRYETRWEPEK
jgi:hypothetical protein